MLIVKNFHTSTNYNALLPLENKDNTDLQNNWLSFPEGNRTLSEKKIGGELDCEQHLFLSSVSHARERGLSGKAARHEKQGRQPEKKKETARTARAN